MALPFMLDMQPYQFVELLLLATNCKPGDYQLGQDMVFSVRTRAACCRS